MSQQEVVLRYAWSMLGGGGDQGVTHNVLSIVLRVYLPIASVFWYISQHMRILWLCFQAEMMLTEPFVVWSENLSFNR